MCFLFFFFFSSRRRHTRSLCDWSSDVCSSDLVVDRADGLVELEVEPDTRRRADGLDDRILAGQQHAAADAVHVGVVPDRKAESAVNAEEELLPVAAGHRGRPASAVRTRRNGNTEDEG